MVISVSVPAEIADNLRNSPINVVSSNVDIGLVLSHSFGAAFPFMAVGRHSVFAGILAAEFTSGSGEGLSMSKELYILVPGLKRESRACQLDRVVRLLPQSAQQKFQPVEEDVPLGARRIRGVDSRNGDTLDFVEAYWNDLVPSLTQAPLGVRFIRGLSLVMYWALGARVWKGFLKRKYLTFGLMLSATAFFAWYFSVLVLVFEAVEVSEVPASIQPLVKQLQAFIGNIGGWEIWAVVWLVVGLLPVNNLVDITDFTKRYLSDEPLQTDGDSVTRHVIVKRIREQIDAALNGEEYDRVTILAHSFGCVVAIDTVKELPALTELRIVTLGSMIELLSSRETWLEEEARAVAARDDLVEWIDVQHSSDWFSSGSGIENFARNCRHEPVSSSETLIDMLAARVHARYFNNQRVAQLVLRTG